MNARGAGATTRLETQPHASNVPEPAADRDGGAQTAETTLAEPSRRQLPTLVSRPPSPIVNKPVRAIVTGLVRGRAATLRPVAEAPAMCNSCGIVTAARFEMSKWLISGARAVSVRRK
jgi:hypothetical protein